MCDFVKKYLQNIVALISVKGLTSLSPFLLSKALFWLDFWKLLLCLFGDFYWWSSPLY